MYTSPEEIKDQEFESNKCYPKSLIPFYKFLICLVFEVHFFIQVVLGTLYFS